MPQDDSVPRGRIRRTMPLAGFTARAVGGRFVAEFRQRSGDTDAVTRFHERTADRYTDLLGHSRGVLMKVGQLMSMVDGDAFGSGGFSPYQKALTRLRADAPPMDVALIRDVLGAELGDAVDLFAEFDDEPMAAASIGQVHRAVLRDGRDVAIKIQYPGVAQAIRDDLANTELLATVMRFATAAAGVAADIRSLAREAAARIAEEVDYRHEAQMITRFGALYRGHPFIRIPEVIPEASGDRVLTMTLLPGMDWETAQHADQELKNRWTEIIARFVHGNFRHGNLLHNDPHPGNYRFGADGTVGFLDFGCVKVLPERLRHPWVAMNRAALEGRFDDCRALMAELGFFATGRPITLDELRSWWDVLLHEMTDMPQPVTYTSAATARLMHALFSPSADNPVNRMLVPEDFSMFPRVQLALTHIGAGMNASLYAKALMDDMDGVAEPVTELGRRHHEWVRQRGLPMALDSHARR
ncbi:ABC1 kinase family protein [Mycolicibacterium wolinskyi]|nr:AarF/UbiB family protein [Mycolicibacterium wolinskyi]